MFDLCILHIFMMFSFYNMKYLEDSMKILVGTTCSKYFVTLKAVSGKGILMSLSPIFHRLLQIYPRTILVRGKSLGFTLLSRPNTSESMWSLHPQQATQRLLLRILIFWPVNDLSWQIRSRTFRLTHDSCFSPHDTPRYKRIINVFLGNETPGPVVSMSINLDSPSWLCWCPLPIH